MKAHISWNFFIKFKKLLIIFLLIVAVNEILILSLPLGTVGERITFTKKPFFLKKDCNSKHFVSSPNIIGIICEFEEPVLMLILFNSFIKKPRVF